MYQYCSVNCFDLTGNHTRTAIMCNAAWYSYLWRQIKDPFFFLLCLEAKFNNFFEVSGHNLESSPDLRFLYGVLKP
jgi:hypothetical protein